MIRIINGTYGYRNPETGIIEAKNSKSEPFGLASEREKQLVEAGVAEYTECAPVHSEEEIKYSERSTKDELKAVAEKVGAEVNEEMTKKEMIAAIEDALDGEEHDPEDAPEIDAALPE